MNKAVFLDRDGVINKAIIKEGKAYAPRTVQEFEIITGVAEEIIRLKKAGYVLIVITNQPEIARGTTPRSHVDVMNAIIRERMAVDGIFVCPHDDPDGCSCRKPKPGLILQAAEKHAIDLKQSFVVGDGWKDMEAARAAGCLEILLDASYNQGVVCFKRVASFQEAVDIILGEKKEERCFF